MKHFFSDLFENKLKIFLALIVLPLLLYAKALFFDFSPMDEQWLIEDNSSFLGKWGSLKQVFLEPSAFIFYRPFFMVSLILDYHFGKLGPFCYHFSNLLFHLFNVLLVFRFLVQFGVKDPVAFGLSLIFAVHPLMLHTVAWIPGRNDSLLCIFVLSSLIFLNKYISGNEPRYFLLHLLLFICALFTKENAIVLSFIFPLLYFSRKKEIKRTLFLFGIWMSISMLWFILRKSIVSYNFTLEGDALTAVKNVLLSLLVFTGKTVFPFEQSVFPTLKNSSLAPGVITVMLLVFLWFFCRPKNKATALFGWILFFGFLIIPVCFGVLKSPGEQYEHRAYTSMAGFLLFISQLEFRLNSKTIRIIFIVMLCMYSIRTYTRMNIYKDKLSFLDAGIKESPDYYYFHVVKGDLLHKKGNYENALQSFNKAIELNPSRPQSYNNRATTYMALGRNKEAIADYTKALDKAGTNAVILTQRCIAYYREGDIEHAMADLSILKKCCQSQIHPDMEKTLNERWEIEKWNRKILADPKNSALYVERARFFMEKRMGKEALEDLRKATELEPNNRTYKEYFFQLSSTLPK